MDAIFRILAVLVLISFSATFSGLNIALMSLDISDLKRKTKLGNARAKRVLPLRQNSHLSLSAILVGNVAAISATSLVLGEAFTGLVAGLLSTFLIVIFGELLPQAFATRYALGFCATLTPVLKLTIWLTYPLSKPLQLLLDRMLGHSQSPLLSRGELGIVIGEYQGRKSGLDEDEIEIMRGALSLSKKRVRDIMTDIRHVYWLTPDTVLDGKKIDELKHENWSRIPVLSKNLSNARGILLMKELVDIDFDESPQKIKDLPLHDVEPVGSMTALDTMFRIFIKARVHLIPVERDDQIVGIVTIEDLIEEILGHEIEDESDTTR